MTAEKSALTLAELAEVSGGKAIGDAKAVFNAVATLEDATPEQVAVLTNSRYRKAIPASQAGCIIVSEEDLGLVSGHSIMHPDPALAYARISRAFHPQPSSSGVVSPQAVIDSTALIAADVEIAAGCVIGANVTIASGAIIGAGCVVMENSTIAANTHLVANVTLSQNVSIGEECLIHPGAVIGSDGFGFANDDGKWVKIPQIGRVIIGNQVEVGANTTIDRGSLRDTVIADGVKLDNQIQIAHNVTIGEHTAIAALVGIAGSTSIGRYCTIGGEAGVIGHLSIGDHCHIAAQTLVTRSLQDGSHVSGGVPAVETRTWRRMIARLRGIDALFERLRSLEKGR